MDRIKKFLSMKGAGRFYSYMCTQIALTSFLAVVEGKGSTSTIEINRIKTRADLPTDFRPLHGLRHAYASMLASSGKVDMYTLQKLLTHKHPSMTQRYAHLRDETLKQAADLAGDLISQAVSESKDEESTTSANS